MPWAWTASFRVIAPALVGFQGFAFLRGERRGIAGGNHLLAFTGAIGPTLSNAADVLIGWNLVLAFGW